MGADLALALVYAPAGQREALRTLFAIDAAMGNVVRTTREPMLGAIRLAWWRERLEELDRGQAPAEPHLQAVAAELLPRGISGRELAELESGWARLFDDFPWDVATAELIWFRGHKLFALGARLLRQDGEAIAAAGGVWALADAARRCSNPPSRAMLLMQLRTLGRGSGGERFPLAQRPLSMLAALAMRDARRGEPFEPEGTPGRALALLRHRLSGRLPQR